MIRNSLGCNVVEAAKRRVLDCFNKNEVVCLSFSGGKDSICTADIVFQTMQQYHIPFSRLFVIFVDEEAIYPDIEKICMQWRSKFMAAGAKFYWFCMPFKHYNCCNRLYDDESFILWEPGKENVWVRPMPPFAIKNHKDFKWGMTYQAFFNKVFAKFANICGVRMSESVQRQSYMTSRKNTDQKVFPLYDWKDSDIWLYIQERNLEFPMSYIYMYKTGVPLNRMRISQFFSIDTIKVLPRVLEYYPDLYQRIIRREPNADLVMLYHDTDMFRSTKEERDFDLKKDYKQMFKDAMNEAIKNPDDYPGYSKVKKTYANMYDWMSSTVWRLAYQILIAGDPKSRTHRALILQINIEKTEHGKANAEAAK